MKRDHTFDRICETLGQLIDGPGPASAILEKEGNAFVVRCHHGFGPDGVENDSIPADHAFASIILASGRTGYLEDNALRPDVVIPRPRSGPPFVGVLAAPLRVGGRSVGTLELYSRQRSQWVESHVALLESLAAQASVSLEASYLFDSVTSERLRLETILQTVPFGVAVCNADATESRLNPAAAAMFNLPSNANEFDPGFQDSVRFYRDGHPVLRDALPLVHAALGGRTTISEEMEVVLAGGQRVLLLLSAAPIRDSAGKPAGAVAAFVNITPLKDLQREIDMRRREAEEASIRKTRFLAAVSHDIRTPANAISLLAELIRRSATSPTMAADVPELATELHNNAMSLVNLLSDVLDIARFDSGRVELQESEFDVARFMADEQGQMLPLARDKGIEVTFDPPEGWLWLQTDRIKLSRILGNLVANAIKFTDRGSVRVTVARTPDGGVRFGVADTGIGIAPEHLRHIFDEFFQLRNPERDRNKGSGLGLTICKRLVDAMGGRLEVQSTPGVGSEFQVTLPPSAVARPPRIGGLVPPVAPTKDRLN